MLDLTSSIIDSVIVTAVFTAIFLIYHFAWAKKNTNSKAGKKPPSRKINQFEKNIIGAYVVTMIILIALIISV